jgi:tetratricopeptide (TPR) repeat protein
VEAPAAFSLAESLGDGSRAVRACIPAILSIITEQVSFATPESGKWAERADRYARSDTVERAFADMSVGAWKYQTGVKPSGLSLLNQAVDLARRLGDQRALWLISSVFFWNLTGPQHIKQCVQLGEELWAGSHAGLNVTSSYTLYWIIQSSLRMGRRQHAEEVLNELRTLAERTGNVHPWLLSITMDATLAVMDGRFDDAMEMSKNIQVRGEEAGLSLLAHAAASPGRRAQLYLGASLETIGREIPIGPPEQISVLYLVQALLGRKEDTLEGLEKYVVNRPGIGTIEDETYVWMDALYLEAAVLVGHRRSAELLLKRFSGTGLRSPEFYPTCIPRHLGGAAALLRRHDDARKYYEEAIKVCTEMRFRPELALTRLQLAELLLEHYPVEKKEALEHLDFAINEFREMKMQPSLERALRHKDILKA